jgi:hypothetical protein
VKYHDSHSGFYVKQLSPRTDPEALARNYGWLKLGAGNPHLQ